MFGTESCVVKYGNAAYNIALQRYKSVLQILFNFQSQTTQALNNQSSNLLPSQWKMIVSKILYFFVQLHKNNEDFVAHFSVVPLYSRDRAEMMWLIPGPSSPAQSRVAVLSPTLSCKTTGNYSTERQQSKICTPPSFDTNIPICTDWPWNLKSLETVPQRKDTGARGGRCGCCNYSQKDTYFCHVAVEESNVPEARKPCGLFCGRVRDRVSSESHLSVQELTVLQRTTQCLQTTKWGQLTSTVLQHLKPSRQ